MGIRTPSSSMSDFPGQYFDQESGLHYNYFRSYDPSTGRFVSSDPVGLGGGLNLYAYAGADPVNYMDPLGLFSLDDARKSLKDRNIEPANKGLLWDSYSDTQVFDEWLRLERGDTKWLEELPPCPGSLNICLSSDTWNKRTKANKYHKPGVYEIRSKTTAGGHSNQCVYDRKGNLIASPPAAGSADYRACPNPPFCIGHYDNDVKPYELAKDLDRINDYYDVRPVIH